MKKAFLLVLALCMALCLCACGGDSNEDAAAPEVTEAPEVPEVTEEVTEAPTEAAPAGIVYSVKLVDEGGNPVVGTMIQICQGELCLMPCATDADGVATFNVTEEGAYEAKLLTLPAGYEYATEEQVFPFGDSLEITITLKAVA